MPAACAPSTQPGVVSLGTSLSLRPLATVVREGPRLLGNHGGQPVALLKPSEKEEETRDHVAGRGKRSGTEQSSNRRLSKSRLTERQVTIRNTGNCQPISCLALFHIKAEIII